jgi:hypothetical protein
MRFAAFFGAGLSLASLFSAVASGMAKTNHHDAMER